MKLSNLVAPDGAIDKLKQSMRRGANDALDWIADDALLLEAALLKWEYVEAPQNPVLRKLWTKMMVDQGSWVHDRGAIDQYVQEFMAAQSGALQGVAP